jgi:hypothetical protein
MWDTASVTVANLVLQYIKSLIWPLVIVVAVLVFRGEVRGLFHRLSSLAGGGFDLKFEADVQSTLQTAQNAADQEVAKTGRPRAIGEPAAAELREESAINVLRDVARQAPEAAVMGAWRLIEIELSDLARRNTLADGRPPRGIGNTISSLGLPPGLQATIRELNDLRSRVTHSESVSVKAAEDYVTSAQLVLFVLDATFEKLDAPRDPPNRR